MLVSEAIAAGYRDANITKLGDAPTAEEQAEALSRLNDFWRALFGIELGEYTQNWLVPPPEKQRGLPENLVSENQGTTWYFNPPVNSRVLLRITADTTLTLPPSPSDGARIGFVDVGSGPYSVTLDANGVLFVNAPTVVYETAAALNGKEFFYRADLGAWVEVKELGLNDVLPLPPVFNDLFVTYIAVRMGPRNEQPAAAEIASMFQAMLKRCKTQYKQSQAVAIANSRVTESEQTFRLGINDWYV